MSKHGTASTLSVDQFAEFASAVVRNLPRDLNPERVQGWIEEGDTLASLLSAAFNGTEEVSAESPAPPAPQKIFMITLPGDKKTSELIKFGRYDWSNDAITDKRFPIASRASQKRTIEYVEFDHDPMSEEVLAEFNRLGLTRPTYEDALCFGIEHPEEQKKRPVVFLHEPSQGAFSGRFVLILFGAGGGRRLGLGGFDDRWDRHYVFAGVRKPQQ